MEITMFEKMFNRETGYFDLYHDDRFRGTLSVAEELAQQIVTALNAWQEIQQAFHTEKTHHDFGIRVEEIIDGLAHEGVIPKPEHSARERLDQSGDGVSREGGICTDCGELTTYDGYCSCIGLD